MHLVIPIATILTLAALGVLVYSSLANEKER